jgi:uncharacterized membrane protein
VPFIKPEDTWLLWAFAVSWVAISIYLEGRFKWASMVSACAISLLGAMVFANIGIIPMASPVYDAINTFILPTALPLLLFTADIKRIIRETGQCFFAYHFAAIGTAVGVFIACLIVPRIPELHGVAAIATGCYTGGAVNMAAMADAFQVSAEVSSATMVGGNVIMALFMVILMTIPKIEFFAKHFRHGIEDNITSLNSNSLTTEEIASTKEGSTLTVLDIAIALGVALVITAVSVRFCAWYSNTGWLFHSILGQKYLVITTVTIILVSLFPKFFSKLKGVEIGTFMIYLFFFGIGTSASIMLIIQKSPMIFIFCIIAAFFNMIGTLGLGRLFNLRLEDLLIASNATIGGPTTAPGMALAQGWHRLIVPGILIGVYGYAVGNYISFTIGNLVLKIFGA